MFRNQNPFKRNFIVLFTFFSIALILLIAPISQANDLNADTNTHRNLKKVFGELSYEISKHDEYLIEIKVGKAFYFATPDARYIYAGTVFDTHQMQDITLLRKNKQRLEYLSEYDPHDFLSYPSKNEKYVVTIFTDIACPYCRKMHQYMDAFNTLGITINYAFLPRGGKNSATYNKTLSALCSQNPSESIDRAMMNRAVDTSQCKDDNILERQQILSQALNITNTPSILLPNGELRLGLISPEQLSAVLKSSAN